MEVVFTINYFAKFGQNISIVGDHPSFGEWNTLGARKMNYEGGGNWKLEFLFPKDVSSFSYRYILSSGSFAEPESGNVRQIDLSEVSPSVLLEDTWRSPSSARVAPHLNSNLFTQVVYGRDASKVTQLPSLTSFQKSSDTVLVSFDIHAIQIAPNCSLRVCGESPALGAWDPKKAPILSDSEFPVWRGVVEIARSQLPTKYKLVITNDNCSLTVWEEGTDRYIQNHKQSVVKIDSTYNQYFEARGAGVAIPVFSIRTENGCGVGEFLDLKKMADWASVSGLKMIQILPINDTSVRGDWRDSYPYSALSVVAFHPIYLNLTAIAKSDDVLRKEIAKQSNEFNKLPTLDYEKVLAYKWSIIEKVFQKEKKDFLNPEVKRWIKENDWVSQYALFCALRDKFKTCDFAQWGEYATITKEKIAELTSPNSPFYDRVLLNYYVQYNLHIQLEEASAYAVTKHVAIKGDIAIGVNPKSVDTWVYPRLFRLDKSTGAPPDFFSDEGQNWGFPTYNWDEMAKDDYTWWRERLRKMAQYFHVFRIDHILGFFRIWEMPATSVSGMLGRFYPSTPIWKDELSGNNMWDLKRLTEPYIRRHLLERMFQDKADDVQRHYFNDAGHGQFSFKPEYDTEKKIVAYLPIETGANVDENTAKNNQKIRTGLLKLIQNVVLLADSEDSNRFYPRIEMHKSSSYSELEAWQKEALYSLYVDYFYNRQEGLWSDTALQRLPVMINSTKMLCCGEDLGMVPKCVDPIMSKLHILSLRIQRMSDDPKKEFYHPDEYPYMSVCTPSVHDSSTLRAWWEEDAETTQRFYNQVLGLGGKSPQHADEWIVSRIITQHLYSKSMWAVFPIQDLFGLNKTYFAGRNPVNDRINIPSNPEHYWKFRMHVTCEALMKDTQFQTQLAQMFRESRRTY